MEAQQMQRIARFIPLHFSFYAKNSHKKNRNSKYKIHMPKQIKVWARDSGCTVYTDSVNCVQWMWWENKVKWSDGETARTANENKCQSKKLICVL